MTNKWGHASTSQRSKRAKKAAELRRCPKCGRNAALAKLFEDSDVGPAKYRCKWTDCRWTGDFYEKRAGQQKLAAKAKRS